MPNLCRKTRNQLSEYIDGALSADNAWKVRMHLSVCAECASVASDLHRTVHLIQNSGSLALTSAFDEKLSRRISSLSPEEVAKGAARARMDRALGNPGVLWRSWKGWALAVAGASAAACIVASTLLTPLKPVDVRSVNSVSAASSSDMAFIAACSSDNARYQSSQPLADPMAQTLAARTDATSASSTVATADPDDF